MESGGAEGSLGLTKDLVKNGCIMNRQLRKALAVQTDPSLFEAVDQLAVTHSTHFGGGRDPDDPHSAEQSLLHLTVTEGEYTCTKQGFLGRFQKATATANITFGCFEQTVPGPASGHTTLGSHVLTITLYRLT
jgi:hypothetical protein